MNKVELREFLSEQQDGKCVIADCQEEPDGYWNGFGVNKPWLLIHRIVPGRLGGTYDPENCVLVCPAHHIPIEGLTRDEIADRTSRSLMTKAKLGAEARLRKRNEWWYRTKAHAALDKKLDEEIAAWYSK